MNELIKVGDKAIEFTLHDQKGQVVKLSDFKGKKVLLSWHPLAWTPVCLDQMRALEVNFDKFVEKNVVPLGMSVDQQFSKGAWGRAINVSKLQMLSDYNPLGQVAKAYGLFNEDLNASGRANVLIDEDGNVAWVKVYEISKVPDIGEVLEQL